MKMFSVICAIALMVSGCSLFESKSSTGVVTLTPLGGAICAVESSVATGAATSIAGTLSCANQAVIVAALEAALGNANLCAAAIPAQAVSAMVVGVSWKTIGDVPKSSLEAKPGAKSLVAKPMGLVGGIACPILINTAMGYLTNSVPTDWGCTNSTTIQAVQAALNAACVAAVPI